MATGVDHYLEAEQNLDRAASASDRGRPDDAAFWMQSALVHSTLAQAAATALSHYNPSTGFVEADQRAWYHAASEGPGEKQRVREARAAEQAEFEAAVQS
jgi:hypothetical protein